MSLPRNNELNEVNKLLSSDIGDISIVDEMVDYFERLEGEGKTTEAIGKLREALEYCEKYKTICDKVKEAAGVEDEWVETRDLLVKIYKGLKEKIRSGIPSLENWQVPLSDIIRFREYGIYYKDMISYLNDMISHLDGLPELMEESQSPPRKL